VANYGIEEGARIRAARNTPESRVAAETHALHESIYERDSERGLKKQLPAIASVPSDYPLLAEECELGMQWLHEKNTCSLSLSLSLSLCFSVLRLKVSVRLGLD